MEADEVVKIALKLMEKYDVGADAWDLVAKKIEDVVQDVVRVGSDVSVKTLGVITLAVAVYEVFGFAYIPVKVDLQEAEGIMLALGYRVVQDEDEVAVVRGLASAEFDELAEDGVNYIVFKNAVFEEVGWD